MGVEWTFGKGQKFDHRRINWHESSHLIGPRRPRPSNLHIRKQNELKIERRESGNTTPPPLCKTRSCLWVQRTTLEADEVSCLWVQRATIVYITVNHIGFSSKIDVHSLSTHRNRTDKSEQVRACPFGRLWLGREWACIYHVSSCTWCQARGRLSSCQCWYQPWLTTLWQTQTYWRQANQYNTACLTDVINDVWSKTDYWPVKVDVRQWRSLFIAGRRTGCTRLFNQLTETWLMLSVQRPTIDLSMLISDMSNDSETDWRQAKLM